jgi:hypothetical protein
MGQAMNAWSHVGVGALKVNKHGRKKNRILPHFLGMVLP